MNLIVLTDGETIYGEIITDIPMDLVQNLIDMVKFDILPEDYCFDDVVTFVNRWKKDKEFVLVVGKDIEKHMVKF